MKLRPAILIFCALFAASAAAQKTASEVTDAQIRDYQRAAEKSCHETGKARGDPPEKVATFCKCMTGVFMKNMTRSEWQNAFFYSVQKRAKEEANVFGPHLAKVRQCTPPAPAPAPGG